MTRNRVTLLGLSGLVVAAACATAPQRQPTATVAQAATPAAVERSAAELIDHEGDSVETADSVPADAPGEGVKFENDWIYDRVGRFRRLSHGTGMLNGRRYDVIEVETPNGDRHKFYFDITENWNRWKPPQPQQ